MSKRAKTAVHFMDEGVLVRGTLSPQRALRLAVEADEGFRIIRNYDGAWPGLDEVDPEDVRRLGDHLHALMAEARPGLYRFVPARPDDWNGFSWYVHPASGRGPGVFEAVEFP